MPRGDKSAYTSKQKRQAEHIEDSWPRRVALEAATSLRKITALDEALAS